MSRARQSAMLAHADTPALPAISLLKPTIDRMQAFRRLNGRHRQHLIVRDLMQGVSLGFGDAPLLNASLTSQTFILNLQLDLSKDDFWQRQIATLLGQKWHRDERMEEIVLQQTDILSFLTLGLPVSGDSHPWLTVLLDAVFDVAFRVATEMKAHFALIRPHEMCIDVAPVIRTPSHGAFPSGHATEAFAAAAVLSAFFPDYRDHLRQMAARIAMNRCFAGVHYPIDQVAGALLGDVVGGLALKRMYGIEPFTSGTPLQPTTMTFTAGQAPDVTVESHAKTSPVLKPLDLRAATAPTIANPAPLDHLAGLVLAELSRKGAP